MKTCTLLRTRKTHTEVMGSITLDGKTLIYTPHNEFMQEVMEHSHLTKEGVVTSPDSPEEWFESLPATYDGAYLRARMDTGTLQSIATATSFSHVLKFNPHHDAKGRFATASLGKDDHNFIKAGAQAYVQQHGLHKLGPRVYVNPDVRASEIADTYEALSHTPDNPKVRASYHALRQEIDAQWNFATNKMHMKFEPWGKEGQPYQNSQEMRKDVLNNHHLFYFTGGDIPPTHPLAGRDARTGETYNNKLRAVHDLFGHAMAGYEFGPRGEENAWVEHSKMFSKAALPALTSETKAQNSWFNYNRGVREAAANGHPIPPGQREFADQKATLLPTRYHQREVKSPEFIGSPNLTKGQNLEDAMKQMDGPETRRYMHAAKMIDSKLGFSSSQQTVGLGMWAGGAESTVVERAKGKVDPDTIRAAAAMMGKISGDITGQTKGQDAMMTWFNDPKGPHTLYEVHVPKVGLKEVSARLEKAGVQYATAIPGTAGVDVLLAHLHPAKDEVATVSRAIGGSTVKEQHGYAEFITKDKYAAIIHDYEKSHAAKSEPGGTGVLDNAVARPYSKILTDPHRLYN